jgi:hypothetical protein
VLFVRLCDACWVRASVVARVTDSLEACVVAHHSLAHSLTWLLPGLEQDLSMVVNRMKMGEKDKERIRACLIVNDVLSIADAQAKRFAMMNEVQPALAPRPPLLPILRYAWAAESGAAHLRCEFDAAGGLWAGGADMFVGRWR